MTEKEFKTGVLADGSRLMQPAFDFPAEALLTLSPQFHGEMVSRQHFVKALNTAIDALNQLDKVKKSLFYGRDNNLTSEGQAGTSDLPDHIAAGAIGMTLSRATDFIHGALGLATESGEMLEALRNAINGHGVDGVNVMEESGDAKWYLAILSVAFGYGWQDDEKAIIAKLRARFPDRFTQFDANNRNLGVEREILEGAPRDVAEMALPIGHRTRRMEGERNLDGDAIEAQKPK